MKNLSKPILERLRGILWEYGTIIHGFIPARRNRLTGRMSIYFSGHWHKADRYYLEYFHPNH